jgi:hypothetical protein
MYGLGLFSNDFGALMAKQIAERSNALSIFWLKKNGYLHEAYRLRHGEKIWTWGEAQSIIEFSVVRLYCGTPEEIMRIELYYRSIDPWTGEKTPISEFVTLSTTSCNYGGRRYWFICPLLKNAKYCGRRVGVLYGVGKYFGCRKCANIAYKVQMRGGKYRFPVTVATVECQEMKIKRCFYKGKPTRKYRRLIKMTARLEKDIILSFELISPYLLKKNSYNVSATQQTK